MEHSFTAGDLVSFRIYHSDWGVVKAVFQSMVVVRWHWSGVNVEDSYHPIGAVQRCAATFGGVVPCSK